MLSKVYKILGKLKDSDGAGVVGYNTADSGDAVGVEGKTESPDGYGLYTEDDASVGGELSTGSISSGEATISSGSVSTPPLLVDYDSGSDIDVGVEIRDSSGTNNEQLTIRGSENGSAEVVFQDINKEMYKWGWRVTSSGDFFLEDHNSIQSRVKFSQGGPMEVISGDLQLSDALTLEQTSEPAAPPTDDVTIWNDDSTIKAKFDDGSTATLATKN